MNVIKQVFFVLVLVGVGLFLTITGIKEYRNSKRLVADGKSTVGKVVGHDEWRGRRGRRSYYITANFNTEANQPVNKRVSVSRDVYDKAVDAGTVPVHYLASDPSVCQFGEKAETKYASIVWGVLALLIGGVLCCGFFQAVNSSSTPATSAAKGSIGGIPAKPVVASAPRSLDKAA